MPDATKEIKCKHCMRPFRPAELEAKYGFQWWTEMYCGTECAVIAQGHIVRRDKGEIIRTSLSIHTELYDRIVEDAENTHRSVNGMILHALTAYYTARELDKVTRY